jgi:hypothetical protein
MHSPRPYRLVRVRPAAATVGAGVGAAAATTAAAGQRELMDEVLVRIIGVIGFPERRGG